MIYVKTRLFLMASKVASITEAVESTNTMLERIENPSREQ